MGKLTVLKDVVLADSATFAKLRDAAGEASVYSSIDVSHGHGRLIRAGVTVQKGIKGKVTVDMTFTSFKDISYTAATDEVRTHLDEKVVEHLDECERQKNHSDWWLWFHSNNESEYEHHKQQNKETIKDTDEKRIQALEKSFTHETQQYHVTGEFEVEGLSMIPTTAYLFVEMLSLKIGSETTTVINSNAVAATEDGDTSDVKIDGDAKLNILPL